MRPIQLALVTLFLLAGSAAAETVDLTIDADAGWVDTGIAITAGEDVQITATGSASPDGIDFYDPDGDGGTCATCLVTLTGARYALVGSIGLLASSDFVAGSIFSFTSTFNGNLFLAFNDDVFGDNAGSFDVTVTVATCGDGLIEINEVCDDGNLTTEDGCDATCNVEPGFSCVGEPSFCEVTGAQSAQQQKCIAKMHKASWFSAKKYGQRVNLCVRDNGRDKLGKRGKGEAETAQQCVDNDDAKAIEKRVTKLAKIDEVQCTRKIEFIPQFGYASAATAGSKAMGAAEGLGVDLFSDNLDAGLVKSKDDSAAAHCQRVAHRFYQKHFDAMWRTASKAVKEAFKATPEIATDEELQTAILDEVEADADGKIQKTADQFLDRTTAACSETEAADLLPTTFLGVCGLDTIADMVACAQQGARCRFCQSLRGIGAYPVDCDVYDEGIANLTCE